MYSIQLLDEESNQHLDVGDFEPQGCGSSFSLYTALSVIQAMMAIAQVLVPSSMIWNRALTPPLIVPGSLLGYVFGIISILGVIYTSHQAYSGSRSVPNATIAKRRVILLGCLLANFIILTVAVFICGVIAAAGPTSNHCYDCGGYHLSLTSYAIAFPISIVTLIISILYVLVLIRANKIWRSLKLDGGA